jgi:GWxTD domain-containing protein
MRVARPVALLESCFVEVPMLFGHAKPLILVPAGFLAGLPASHVEAILLHELAHVRRHDYLVNLFQRLIESVMFHHPAAWWISRVIRAERENCCDDAVVAATGNAPEYANALAGLEQWRWPNQHAAVAATGGNLTNRISRLLFPRTKYPAATPLFAASLLSAVFAFTLAAWQAAPPARTDTPYDRWLDQDAVYLISGEERAAFLKLASDPEREKFIEQFWLRRDPTPGTERNEFQIEHYRRIDYANKRFGAGAKPGWRTDRGYMYIVYGPPDEIESHPSGGGRAYGTEAWKYRTIEGMGQNLFVFFIDRMNSGDYRLAPGSVR